MCIEVTRGLLPKRLAKTVSGFRAQQIFTGCSTASVFRLWQPHGSCFYLKIAPHDHDGELLHEKLRLEWLQGRLPVPRVEMLVQDENHDYLLLSEIVGADASDDSFQTNAPKIIEALAAGLRLIHALPIDSCPFNATLDTKLELARKRMMSGLVDESDFDEARSGRTAADLFLELLEIAPEGEDLVFTHGDYCLPNIILHNGKLSGFIDWGRAGVADRYQDIALAARSVASNFGAEWVDALFDLCGIKPDHAKLHFYTLLDEFF